MKVVQTIIIFAIGVLGSPVSIRAETVPGRATIAGIETGLALLENLRTVGVYDTKTMNRDARRKVRKIDCKPRGTDGATCSYEVDHCAPAWCQRTNHFVRSVEKFPTVPAYRGWKLVLTD
jgi:hypothetical protein